MNKQEIVFKNYTNKSTNNEIAYLPLVVYLIDCDSFKLHISGVKTVKTKKNLFQNQRR